MSEGRKPYSEMSNEELEALERKLKAEYKKIQGLGLEPEYVKRKALCGTA